MRLIAFDREVFSKPQPIGDAQATFDGRLPLRLESEGVRLECRDVPPERAARFVA